MKTLFSLSLVAACLLVAAFFGARHRGGRPAMAAPSPPLAASVNATASTPLPAAGEATAPASAIASTSGAKPDEVPRLDTLHAYAVDAVLTLTPPYAERDLESVENRRARWTTFALECADAVEASDLPKVDHPKWLLTLIWIAHRETLIAEVPRRVGNEDEGLASGPWQIHSEGEWKKMDTHRATTALAMLRKSAGAWSLPQGKPWLGLAADRGKHGVNRPSVMEYLQAHPYPANL